jgi:hypothetical protein
MDPSLSLGTSEKLATMIFANSLRSRGCHAALLSFILSSFTGHDRDMAHRIKAVLQGTLRI